MYVFLVQYDDFEKNTNIFSSFNKAKLDIIYYMRNEKIQNFDDWDWEALQKEWNEYAKEQGYSNWMQGLLGCPYEKINTYLGDFASIEKIKVDKYRWRT